MPERTVKAGECLASIAQETGFFIQTLWEHPSNAALRSERASPHILRVGDVVHVPELRESPRSIDTGKRHVFRRLGVPEILRVTIRHGERARAHAAYALTVDGKRLDGTTDGEGRLEVYVQPRAQSGRLVFEESGDFPRAEYEIMFRRMAPIDTPEGVQARLKNLGLYSGAVDGAPNPGLTEAVSAFQQSQGIPVTGEIDARLRDALTAAHGS